MRSSERNSRKRRATGVAKQPSLGKPSVSSTHRKRLERLPNLGISEESYQKIIKAVEEWQKKNPAVAMDLDLSASSSKTASQETARSMVVHTVNGGVSEINVPIDFSKESAISKLNNKIDMLDKKIEAIDRKLDQILSLLEKGTTVQVPNP